jgi:flavin reductase (DIM6/NTAB) family NADH-FMN oxidoreductase RutF
MPIAPDLFRSIMGSFPAGVAVVTAVAEDGTPRGLTSNAVCSVSLDPPLLLVCVDRDSNTLAALNHSGSFVVNFLAGGRERLSQWFARKNPDKFRDVDWRPSELADGAPILSADCVAYAECRTVQEIEAGDHVIFLGEVGGGDVVIGGAPLIFRRGEYRDWPVEAGAP